MTITLDLGLVPEGGSSALLPQMLGHRHAADLLLLGRAFDAEHAAKIGIINGVCKTAELQAHSRSVAEQLAAKPPHALEQAKAMLKRNPCQPLTEVIDRELNQFMECLAGEEAQQVLRGMIKPSL